MRNEELWMIDSLVVPASLHDTQGRFIRMNEAAERASGLPNAKLRGRHFTELLVPEERKKVAELFRLADAARVLTDPELAARRMSEVLAVGGIH